MTETVLPGVFIDVRPEALIVPGSITISNIGIVGTAAKGEPGTPTLLGSYADAVTAFGTPDRFENGGKELTLVRALQQAYKFGATTVWAVRVAGDPTPATATLDSAAGACVELTAASPGTWGNDLTVTVESADADAFVTAETVTGSPLALEHKPLPSAANRVVVRPAGGGADQTPTIVYEGTAGPTQVKLDPGNGSVTFGTTPPADATVLASYAVAKDSARKITVKAGITAQETYTVVSGTDLVQDLQGSVLVTGVAAANVRQLPGPATLPSTPAPQPLSGGTNGVTNADYPAGLDALLEVEAHLILAAGQDHTKLGNALAAHCARASTDELKRDRIAVVGTGLQPNRETEVTEAAGHSLDSDRVVLVAPGFKLTDPKQGPDPFAVPGAYTAAAVAGLLSAQPPHVSLTNKVLAVDDLEHAFTTAQLRQLVLARVLVVEKRQGFRVVRGITTSTNTAFQQITTRRIVDYAKAGVRSAATEYIGLLNNERVRGTLRAAINAFLATMVTDEMLTDYKIDVHASRADEIRGIALVDLTVQPTFSIDFIKVTMFLQ